MHSIRRIRRLSAIAAVVLAANANAADLLEVYRDAAVYDAQYAAARAVRDAGREKLPQGRALVLPSINLSGETSRTRLDATLDTFPTATPDKRPFDTRSYAVTLVQPLYREQNFVQYSEAEYLVQQSEVSYAAARQDLILRVAQAYFGVLGAQDALTLIRAQKAAIAEQLARAKHSFEVGAATMTDTHEAQARYDLAVAQEIAAQSALDVAERALQQLTGKTYDSLQPLREQVALATLKPDELSTWVDLGRNQSYPVILQKAQVELQTLEIKRNRAGHYPTLDLVASYGGVDQSGTVLTPIGSRAAIGTVGLQLNLPLYAGGAVTSRTREAAALLEKARAELDGVRRQQALAVEQNFLNVISGVNQVRALEQALTSSESALASNQLGYDVGVRINIDVLNAQQQVYSTRRELSAARYGTILNQLRLKAAVGSLVDADVEEVNRALSPADAPSG
ncbi:MAG: TolC family outer membrane protein [Sulfurifustis sp.]